MFYKIVAVTLISLLLHSSASAVGQPQSSSQTQPQMQAVLLKAQDRDKAVKVVLNKSIPDRKKIVGKVNEISDVGFVITDRKTGNTVKLEYPNVREIKQAGFPRGWAIALVVVAGFVVVVVVATKPWRSE